MQQSQPTKRARHPEIVTQGLDIGAVAAVPATARSVEALTVGGDDSSAPSVAALDCCIAWILGGRDAGFF
jgi:hypothetical protein